MLVTFQFPIADARRFEPRLDLRLPFPDWPDPTTSISPHFVHHFGQAVERFGEADEAWPDEIKFCRAKRALRFDRLETRHANPLGERFCPQCAFRRFFFDGQAVARLEAGISNDRRRHDFLYGLDMNDILAIVRDLSELPTTVRHNGGKPHRGAIIRQGKALARLFAHASMREADTQVVQEAMQLVEVGDPLILVELGKHEADFSPIDEDFSLIDEGITTVPPAEINGARAYFCRLQIPSGIVATWILDPGVSTKAQLRSLRICLTRLHAEQEVLDRVLKQIRRGRLLDPGSEEAVDRLDSYFNERIKVINRGKWAGINQSQILAAFDATQKVMRPASKAVLVDRYNGARRQVWQKIQRFQERRSATRRVYVLNLEDGAIKVEKNVTVSGTGNIVNVAEYMSNITNTVNNNLEQVADNQVRDLIAELNKQIEILALEADPQQTKKMGKNLERLSEEAASEEPDRRWYELSVDGIKEAAEAVGEIASPILATIAKLSPLLLP